MVPDETGGDVERALTAARETPYWWAIAEGTIRWGDNAAEVFAVPSVAPIATADGYAAIADPSSVTTRQAAVLNASAADGGDGVFYEVQYTLFPDGPGTARRLIVEDAGRWYAGADGRPARAEGVVRIINDRHEREMRQAYLSRYDELTGYLNRSHLIAALAEAMNDARRHRYPVAFMIVAIDNFTALNEAYGFETADRVFAIVARRIKAELREGDSIGRYSGNKLGIVLMRCEEADMYAAAERFHAAARNGVVTAHESSVAITVSIGGVGLPRYGRTASEAMARAQESLHRARKRGRGRFVAYAPSSARSARRRRNAELSSEVVAAIESGRLGLHFQPVVEIGQRRPVFYEALLRLERDQGELAPAGSFIEICERLGLIRIVDAFALGRALDFLRSVPDVCLSINVSAETVGDADWLSRLAEAGREDPNLPRRLIVEITETAVIRSLEEASHFIATLHDLGSRVAIDDFGAGFSSFRSLRALDIDIVKIDGSFVENLAHNKDDQAFVCALSQLAHAFGIEIVAEWVQDEAAAALLKQYGVHMLQGTLVGDAVPASDLAAALAPRAASA